ncbi:hypothetical protein V6N12_044414 [Hibiscus sabdariffa]|uniref:DUF4283 domain-containing protein n=1 Tax=Hibiscus sabdariffa TaxID=183260 RepID=A0ABR2AIW2_9ROSI
MEIFWDLRNSTIKPWFEDIDTIEIFMKSQKHKVWLCIQGLPLEAWNELAFLSIASRWGKLIRLDTDTGDKKRLDIARILIGIKCPHVIPPFLPIKLNGSISYLKLSLAEFEEERVWIDNGKVKSFSEGSLVCSLDSPGKSCMENP